MAGLVGCSTTIVKDPARGALLGSAPEEQMEFWHKMAESKLASRDEAFHGVLLLLDGKDPAPDYPARVAALKDRGILSNRFDKPGDQTIRRGELAAVLAKALDIKGGLIMRVVGSCPRYALREMVYRNLFPPDSSEQQALTGRDFVAIAGRVDDYQQFIATEPGYKPAGHEPHAPAHVRVTPTPGLEPLKLRPVGPALALAGDRQSSVVDSPRLAFFQDKPAPAPAPAPVDGKPLTVEITKVKGAVQQRAAEDQPWQPAAVGQKLGTGSDIRTGVRSSVTLQVEPGRTITLDRLGVTRVLAAIEQGGATKVDLGAKYGRGRIVVEKGGREYETTISTPGMTLAIRGTSIDWLDQGWTHVALGADGVVHYISHLEHVNLNFAGPGRHAAVKLGYENPNTLALDESQQTPNTQLNSDTEEQIDQQNSAILGFLFRDIGVEESQHLSHAAAQGRNPQGPPVQPPGKKSPQ